MTSARTRAPSHDGEACDTTPIDVAVVGAIGVDTLAYPPATWHFDGGDEGTLARVERVVAHGGGYASRGYAALGYRTAFVGHVGADCDGELVQQTLGSDGVDLSACVVSGRTASSVNVVAADGARRNFYDPRLEGVHPPTTDLIERVVSRARLVHVNIPSWTRNVLPLARACGVVIAVDIQDATGPDDAYRLDFVVGADLLFASAARLDDPEGYARWALGAGSARLVVIGLGPQGCLVVPRDGATEHVGAIGHLPDPGSGHDRPVVDTNGAGDSLAVGIASALALDGLPLSDAVQRGLLCARWCCSLQATSDGLISRDVLGWLSQPPRR